MSIRIYNLAKELGVENNVVLDVCMRFGISGVVVQNNSETSEPKGKAYSYAKLLPLSSISDEDADRVRKFFAESQSGRAN